MAYVLAINPGSTSTKVALFCDETAVFRVSIDHTPEELSQFSTLEQQKPFRTQKVMELLKQYRIEPAQIDAFVGRGGGQETMEGGTYNINELMYEHARICYRAKHPAVLGSQIAADLAKQAGKPSFVVNPPIVDEFIPEARITGVKGIYRRSHVHALNQKEIAIRYAASCARAYEEMNLIVAHLGGGISVTAHRKGRMIDSNDCLGSSGAFAPTRCGSVPALDWMKCITSGEYSLNEIHDLVTKNGGLVSHLGTSDVRVVRERIAQGDGYAKVVLDAMVLQIEKEIGAMSAVLKGRVDAIVLTGGISHDKELTGQIRSDMGYLAPVVVCPGEFEMEAMASGALRVLRGQEQAKEYTGQPVWDPALFEQQCSAVE